ncbi:STAS/SEC14 domain-containing protein [Bradyrhizobium lablabi]|uniref:STAS/SEC14 domain-containing protein n=1 Tax=Bradyrhizobium lablabi TaxID=722472 RepID=UPI001BA4C96E|nr:STAS/SEC14 domain-containing protein [Bradyrhizobium lablabi]MBR0695704.1 STAS/SEC14 domain-containing protein [Bradyrhizobium lablabi]
MIELELLRDKGVLIVVPNGPLAKGDFARLAEEIDPFVAANGKLRGLMVCVKTFPGWDSFGGFVSHLEFVRDHQRKIDRIAAVTDSGGLKVMTQIAKHVVSPQVRQFPASQRTEALAWLEAGR